jgi:aryl-alcohol dehydrogenase-like predicted oxidoreductase
VLVKEALANGRLTPRGDAAGGALGAVALEVGATVDAVALATAQAQPFADVVLLGASTVAQLGSNLKALELQLPQTCLERLGTAREDAAAYWRRRSTLPWS